MKIIKEARAGTLESSDVLVKVSPAEGELNIIINSEVMKQFGETIRQVITDTLAALNVTNALVVVEDKGALDCVIRARVQSAVMRGVGEENIDWEKL